jgi:hypothetical protein
MPGLPGSYRLFPVVSGPRAESVLTPARYPGPIYAVVGGVDATAEAGQIQAGYTRGIYEVHGPRVGLGVLVLQVPLAFGGRLLASPAYSLSAGLLYSLRVSSVTVLVRSCRVQGPVLRSKSRPKPTHLPVIFRPVGSSRSWIAPW